MKYEFESQFRQVPEPRQDRAAEEKEDSDGALAAVGMGATIAAFAIGGPVGRQSRRTIPSASSSTKVSVGVAFFPPETYHVSYPLSVSCEECQYVELHGVQKVASSNLVAPTRKARCSNELRRAFFLRS
jgi:hypothetical protein